MSSMAMTGKSGGEPWKTPDSSRRRIHDARKMVARFCLTMLCMVMAQPVHTRLLAAFIVLYPARLTCTDIHLYTSFSASHCVEPSLAQHQPTLQKTLCRHHWSYGSRTFSAAYNHSIGRFLTDVYRSLVDPLSKLAISRDDGR